MSMSGAFLQRLSRFTPDAGKLDRDALLFEAGRTSARPNRGWMTVASLLAVTQALSLVVLWPHPTSPHSRLSVTVATVPVPRAGFESPTSEAFVNPGLWSPRHRLLESEAEDHSAGDVTLIDSGPPLRAFGPPPAPLLN
jgi:hypothetical protein